MSAAQARKALFGSSYGVKSGSDTLGMCALGPC